MIPNSKWNDKERAGETDLQRLDRNFGELLQEIRVAQTGTQILFAFLLTLTFTDRFEELSDFQITIYMITLCLAFVATGCLIGPVAYHRMTFRKKMRLELVKAANILSILGLVFLAFALISSVFLVADMAVGAIFALVLTIIAMLWLLLLWFALPLIETRRKGNDPDSD